LECAFGVAGKMEDAGVNGIYLLRLDSGCGILIFK
jgi:hypothetical protein